MPIVVFGPEELDGVAFARRVRRAPYGRAARRALLRRVRGRLLDAGATDAQCAPLDEVAGLFDRVLDDPALPLHARPLLWRLQAPVIRLVLLEADRLDGRPRALHRMVEDIAAILAGGPDGPDARQIGERVEALIAAIDRVAAALQVRSALLAAQWRGQRAPAAGDASRLADQSADERIDPEPGARPDDSLP